MAGGKLLTILPWLRPQTALVRGRSMEPTLVDGSWIVALASGNRSPRVGEVVILEHPERPGFELVKRVAAVSLSAGLVWVAGDNREGSTDSEEFGPVAVCLVRARVVARLRPWPPLLLTRDPAKLR